MDENIKNGLKKLAADAETGIAKSILRWKYKKKGHPVPGEETLEAKSRVVADAAHDILAEKGKNVWKDIKEIYVKKGRREEDSTK